MIIPSIDLQNGRAVQLRQGRELLLTDPRDPAELARELGRYGPVAVVDLDAALGRGENREIVRACCRVASCRVGGGIRSHDDVRDHIRHGAEKVVIGTLATPEFLEPLPAEWIVAALDTRGEEVLTHGWTRGSGRRLLDEARRIAPYCSELLFTQVEREGMLSGSDVELASRLREVVRLPITVAGGIRSAEEIVALEREGFNSQIGRGLYEGKIDLTEAWIACIAFDDRGLVPVVVQDADTEAVLMLAYGNAESLSRALRRGEGWYWSRSREALWRKGETSGHTQQLLRAFYDCDRDTVLFRVRQRGPACHRGHGNCFADATEPTLRALERVIATRKRSDAASSYTRRLLDEPASLAGKLREETEEVIEARGGDHLAWECADLLYHLMVRMGAAGIPLKRVESELRSRFR
jgi:phosphoribosyl-ATP pyrophosphohydrolase